MDFLTDRLERYPEMHVYHYASYEPTALKRLMGRHGTREDEVDRLLRGGVLVDLFRAVRQGLRASVESYSIKKIEPLYDFTRQEGTAGRRLEHRRVRGVARSSATETGRRPTILDLDRDLQPRRRAEHAAPAGLARGAAPRARRRDRPGGPAAGAALAGRAGAAPRGRCARPGGRRRAHRRRPRRPDRAQRRAAGAVAARPAPVVASARGKGRVLGLLPSARDGRGGAGGRQAGARSAGGRSDRSASPGSHGRGRSYARQTWRYRFAPQDYDIGSRSAVRPGALPAAARREVERRGRCARRLRAVDDTQSTVDLQLAGRRGAASPGGAGPAQHLRRQGAARGAPRAWASGSRSTGSTPPARGAPARDLLLRRPPSVGQVASDPLQQPGESGLDAACRMVEAMDHGALAIQGPPGSGKTYTGARMVVRLVRERQEGGHQRQQPQGDRQLPERTSRMPLPKPVCRSDASRRSPRTTRPSTTTA